MLRNDIKQNKPFSSREEEVFLNILRTAEALSWEAIEVIKEADLTSAQYNVLRILRGAGETGATCSEISDRLIKRDPDITRLLDRLETRGLITRQRETCDRRVIRVRVTDEGLRLLAGLDEPVQQINRQLLGHLGQEQLELLNSLLDAVRNRPS